MLERVDSAEAAGVMTKCSPVQVISGSEYFRSYTDWIRDAGSSQMKILLPRLSVGSALNITP